MNNKRKVIDEGGRRGRGEEERTAELRPSFFFHGLLKYAGKSTCCNACVRVSDRWFVCSFVKLNLSYNVTKHFAFILTEQYIILVSNRSLTFSIETKLNRWNAWFYFDISFIQLLLLLLANILMRKFSTWLHFINWSISCFVLFSSSFMFIWKRNGKKRQTFIGHFQMNILIVRCTSLPTDISSTNIIRYIVIQSKHSNYR